MQDYYSLQRKTTNMHPHNVKSLRPECSADAPCFLNAVYQNSTQMKKAQADTPQYGRSMIEMLGVLAIIGVISIGGFGIVGKALDSKDLVQIKTEISSLVSSTIKMACQYDEAFNNKGAYTAFLYRSEAYPRDLSYDSTNKKFVSSTDVAYKILGDKDYFHVEVSNLSEAACLEVATTNWGNEERTGHIGVAVGTNDVSTQMKCTHDCTAPDYAIYSSDDSYPMLPDVAANYCTGANNTVQIWYKACR